MTVNYKVLSEVNTALPRFVAGEDVVLSLLPLVAPLAGHRLRIARHFTAALPAQIGVLFLSRRNQPKTATRLAQDRGTQ